MSINLVKLYRKRLRAELRNMGYSRFKSWYLERSVPDEIIHESIGNFGSPKDMAVMISQ